jgi:hypothetical protein
MGLVPANPEPEDGCGDGAEYEYSATGASPATYSITFCLGGNVGDLSSGNATADPNGISQ